MQPNLKTDIKIFMSSVVSSWMLAFEATRLFKKILSVLYNFFSNELRGMQKFPNAALLDVNTHALPSYPIVTKLKGGQGKISGHTAS